MPKKTPKQKTGNPFYRGASPEEVARALLQRAPKKPKAKPDPSKARTEAQAPIESSQTALRGFGVSRK